MHERNNVQWNVGSDFTISRRGRKEKGRKGRWGGKKKKSGRRKPVELQRRGGEQRRSRDLDASSIPLVAC